mmetsp:Transcript_90120/g.209674  ORF Transcript_90120/g.209674 Transcript_90120/m.209674 type:complete len:226 (+) Transcript_90120:231-908(+)
MAFCNNCRLALLYLVNDTSVCRHMPWCSSQKAWEKRRLAFHLLATRSFAAAGSWLLPSKHTKTERVLSTGTAVTAALPFTACPCTTASLNRSSRKMVTASPLSATAESLKPSAFNMCTKSSGDGSAKRSSVSDFTRLSMAPRSGMSPPTLSCPCCDCTWCTNSSKDSVVSLRAEGNALTKRPSNDEKALKLPTKIFRHSASASNVALSYLVKKMSRSKHTLLSSA